MEQVRKSSDASQIRYRMLHFETDQEPCNQECESTLSLCTQIEELVAAPKLEQSVAFAKQVETYRAQHDRVVWDVGCTYALPLAVLGEDEFFIRVITEREQMREFCIRYACKRAEVLVQTMAVMQKRPDVLLFSDPFGEENARMIRPMVFRTLLKPAQQFLVSGIKRAFPELQIWYRCCATSHPLIPDFVDIGFDAWIPIGEMDALEQELQECRQSAQGNLRLFGMTENQWNKWTRGKTACMMRSI